MASILIAGGSGLIGQRLSILLAEQGHNVSLLSRKGGSSGPWRTFAWDPSRGEMDLDAILQADAVINLAGAGIADARWTAARKNEIIKSRVQSTQLLLDSFKRAGHTPKCYLSGAAIGYYGHRGDTILSEDALPGTGFLAESCVAWENAIREVALTGIRTVIFRIGIVLSTHGGALEKMLIPAKMGVGTYFGAGNQWYSWIHIDDVCRMFIHAIENQTMEGTFNAVAPSPATNKALTAALMRAMNRPQILLSAPAFALELAMGEMASVVLNGTRVDASKIVSSGFVFRHPDLEAALLDLISRKI
jgi:uncharacterized protein (TIGR01777 family)